MKKIRIAVNSLICLAALAKNPAVYAQVAGTNFEKDTTTQAQEQISKMKAEIQKNAAGKSVADQSVIDHASSEDIRVILASIGVWGATGQKTRLRN